MLNNRAKPTGIWLSVLFLFICVAATTVAVLSRLDGYLLNDEGAISLLMNENQAETNPITPDTEEEQGVGTNATLSPSTEQENEGSGAVDTRPDDTQPAETRPPKNPGFEVGDDQTVWSTDTQVEIFRVSYVNGEQIITVNSSDGDKVIAPGTENSYTFKLKNTGNVALDYVVEVDAYFTPGDIAIPITARLNRYDGKWVVGGRDEYVDVPTLDTAEDGGTLGAGKYTYYTLDWSWPFESGNDELDTMLGNLAAEQDLIFTIAIRTTATESDNPDDDGGITPPQTGDDSNLAFWIAVAVLSFAMMVYLMVYYKKRAVEE